MCSASETVATPLAEPLPLATPLAAPLPLTAPPIADAPLVKPELPKTPTLPDMRYVKREATKVQKQTKYDDELSKWRELKQLYDEVQYPAYRAEQKRRAAAEQRRREAPEVQQRRELRAAQTLERAVQRDAASRAREEEKAQRWREREREREHREQQWRERKRRWAVSEERREEERHAVRCQGINKAGKQCRVLSCHGYEHARPLRASWGGMFCAYHVGQDREPGWCERLAEAQEEESYAPSRYAVRARGPPSFGGRL